MKSISCRMGQYPLAVYEGDVGGLSGSSADKLRSFGHIVRRYLLFIEYCLMGNKYGIKIKHDILSNDRCCQFIWFG